MANAANVIGKFTEETGELVKETARDAKDAVGEMIEQGVQSAVSPQMTPQQLQQKQQEDQKKETDRQKQLAYTRRWLTDLQMAQQKIRQDEKQKKMQKQNEQTQEEQKKKVEQVQQKQASKKPGGTMQDALLRSQAEYKPGKGVGG